jgi:hypothetical protein
VVLVRRPRRGTCAPSVRHSGRGGAGATTRGQRGTRADEEAKWWCWSARLGAEAEAAGYVGRDGSGGRRGGAGQKDAGLGRGRTGMVGPTGWDAR